MCLSRKLGNEPVPASNLHMGTSQLLRWHDAGLCQTRNSIAEDVRTMLFNHDNVKKYALSQKLQLQQVSARYWCDAANQSAGHIRSVMCCTTITASTASDVCRCICCCQQQQWVPSCHPDDRHRSHWSQVPGLSAGCARSAHFAAPFCHTASPLSSHQAASSPKPTCSRQNSLHTRNKDLSLEYQ